MVERRMAPRWDSIRYACVTIAVRLRRENCGSIARQTPSAPMRIVRIFTTETGGSAIEVRRVPMTGTARPASQTFACREIFFRETPDGHVQDYHNAPRRQLIFLTSGVLELEASDGVRVVCKPGDLIFAEDLQGKGHITRSLRGVRGFVHVAVTEDFDVGAWPLERA